MRPVTSVLQDASNPHHPFLLWLVKQAERISQEFAEDFRLRADYLGVDSVLRLVERGESTLCPGNGTGRSSFQDLLPSIIASCEARQLRLLSSREVKRGQIPKHRLEQDGFLCECHRHEYSSRDDGRERVLASKAKTRAVLGSFLTMSVRCSLQA